jgi:hypothetical protein
MIRAERRPDSLTAGNLVSLAKNLMVNFESPAVSFSAHPRLETSLFSTVRVGLAKKIDWGLDMIDRLLTSSGYAAGIKRPI